MLDKRARVTMDGYVRELILSEGANKRAGALTPAKPDMNHVDTSSPRLGDKERERFHTVVAKLLYLTHRVKPEMMLAVNFLCTRVKEATVQDRSKLDRVLSYVFQTECTGIVLGGANTNQVVGMIDAAFGTDGEMKSRSGMAIFLGKSMILAKATKQKCVSRNVAEAELTALSDNDNSVLHCNAFLEGQGLVMKKPIIYQDNQAVIALVNGTGGAWSVKHQMVRRASVRERVRDNMYEIVYMRTEEMVADILTKPLQGKLFRRLKAVLTGKQFKEEGGASE